MKSIAYALFILSIASQVSYAANKNVATVNGKPISQATYDAYIKYKQAKIPGFDPSQNKQAVIYELVGRELMYQDALNKKFDKDPDVIDQIAQQRINLLIKYAIKEATKDKQITDAEMKEEYDTQIKQANLKEYKARHILVKTEEEATKIIGQLEKNKPFAELAKAYSIGPTGKNGGELGWFNTSQMVPTFAQAVTELNKGNYTKKPVQTKFGWHVILLEDTRKREPPTYESVKRNLALILQNKRVKQYIDQLRKNADIKITK